MTDVLIVGGGPAGAALALLLGRRGLRVELCERDRFPREKPCGEGLMPAGVAVLQRLGLAKAVGGAPFHGVRYNLDGMVATGRFPTANGGAATGLAQRRARFDHVLFQAAAATPGVSAFTGAAVEALLRENGRIAGVVADGQPRRAKLVVAADGAHSRIRALLGWNPPPNQRKRVGMRAHFRLAAGQPQEPWVDIFVAPGHELYVTPLPERELLVAALADAGALRGPQDGPSRNGGRHIAAPTPAAPNGGLKPAATSGGITNATARMFERWRQSHRALAARLEGAEQVSELLTTSPLSGRARHGAAPGIVLLGDAAGFCDPVTGGGMAQALTSAELLAAYVARYGVEKQDWLDDFDRERRAMLRDYVRLTGAMVWLTEHPRLARAAVGFTAHTPRLLSHLVGVAGGVRSLVGFGNGRMHAE